MENEDRPEKSPEDVLDRLLDGTSSDFVLLALTSGFEGPGRWPLAVGSFRSALESTRFEGVIRFGNSSHVSLFCWCWFDMAVRSSDMPFLLCRLSIRRSRIPFALLSLTAKLRNSPLPRCEEEDRSPDSGLFDSDGDDVDTTSVLMCNERFSLTSAGAAGSSTQSAGVGGTRPRAVPNIGGFRPMELCRARLEDASEEPLAL